MRQPKPSTAPETRLNVHLEECAAAVKAGKDKLLKPKKVAPTAQAAPEAASPQKARQPAGTIPASSNATPDAYGLQIDENGLGLHAAPGASVLVEPEMPIKAGLAVFYMKGGRGPAIFDLTRHFHPEFAHPFAPGSEVTPLIEVVDPVNRPSNRAMLERRLASANLGLMYASDGPYTEAQLRERIVGTVVGVLMPQRRASLAVAAEARPDPADRSDPLAHVDPIDGKHERTNTAAASDALISAVSPALRAAIEAHRDAFTASRIDPDDSDANMDRHYAVIDQAADAINAVPSSTLADQAPLCVQRVRS